MRLYPGGFTIGRQAIEAVDIGGYTIPAEAWVMVSPFSVQRMPETFPDPERFDPDRFANDAERSWQRGAYLPFGLGARTCIGSQFAVMEGHTVVSTLTQAVQFESVSTEPVSVRPMIALSPDRPIYMRIRQRQL
jgi:cytochrome P450